MYITKSAYYQLETKQCYSQLNYGDAAKHLEEKKQEEKKEREKGYQLYEKNCASRNGMYKWVIDEPDIDLHDSSDI